MFFVGARRGSQGKATAAATALTKTDVPRDLNMFILENQWNWNPIVVAPLVSDRAMLAQIGKQEVFNIQMTTNTINLLPEISASAFPLPMAGRLAGSVPRLRKSLNRCWIEENDWILAAFLISSATSST